MIRLVALVVPFILVGCATTKQYLPAPDSAQLDPNSALITVIRKNEFIGGGRSLQISDDGKVVGQLSPGKQLEWERPSGEFQIQIVPAAGVASHPTPLRVKVEPGHHYSFNVFWGGSTFELKQAER